MNDKNTEIVNQEEQEKRRTLLKQLGAGSTSVLVARWVAPVVTAVAIPAHAQTSFSQSFTATFP
jgi:hypothetical protein